MNRPNIEYCSYCHGNNEHDCNQCKTTYQLCCEELTQHVKEFLEEQEQSGCSTAR